MNVTDDERQTTDKKRQRPGRLIIFLHDLYHVAHMIMRASKTFSLTQ